MNIVDPLEPAVNYYLAVWYAIPNPIKLFIMLGIGLFGISALLRLFVR